MNATSVTRADLVGGESSGDSDSDTISDGIPDYYEPISSLDGEGDGVSNEPNSNGYHHVIEIDPHSTLSNGQDYRAPAMENGLRSLNISEDEERENEDGDEDEDEDEERRRAELDSAMQRAFEEDESRRNAPLPQENAVRVMEAMRGVSFSGMAPDWVTDVSEDRWADQLRRLRQQPPHSAAF